MPLVYITRSSDEQSNIRHNLGQILQKQTLVDMTLICTTHSIRVHKAVLAANSNYLEKVITSFQDEVIVVLKDVSFQALRGLIEYMYRGHTGVEESHTKEMIAAGKCLGVTGLTDLHKLQGTMQNDPRNGYSQFQLTNLGDSTINRPIIFIRRREKQVNNTKVPIVIEMHTTKPSSKTHNRKENKSTIVSNDMNYNNDANKSDKALNLSIGQKPETDELLQATNDVEILRIPFELKNNKPVRNQIKEYIGETMPELILKPRRGRPSVKPVMERSLIKNNHLYQITLDNSDEVLRSEESMSKKTIAKMEKQMYGRDIQQQFVIEQAVSSIVGLNSPSCDEESNQPIIIDNTNQYISSDQLQSTDEFPELNLLLGEDFYNNELVQQSDIGQNIQYHNIEGLCVENNELNFSDVSNMGYAIINQNDGEQLLINPNEAPILDYENMPLLLNQLNYTFDNNYFGENGELNEELLFQSAFPGLQILHQPGDNTISIPETSVQQQNQALFDILSGNDETCDVPSVNNSMCNLFDGSNVYQNETSAVSDSLKQTDNELGIEWFQRTQENDGVVESAEPVIKQEAPINVVESKNLDERPCSIDNSNNNFDYFPLNEISHNSQMESRSKRSYGLSSDSERGSKKRKYRHPKQ